MRQKRYTLKREPGDFLVEELLDYTLTDDGEFALYRLTKEDMDTPTALNIASALLGVESGLGHCGMKDRYSRSVQYFSVPWTPELTRTVADRSVSAELVGRMENPLILGAHKGNRFEITIRDLSEKLIERIERSVSFLSTPEDPATGPALALPNYFDSQRFTYQLSPPDDPIAHIMAGDLETALKQMIAHPFRKERRNVKNSKRLIAENWGDWQKAIDGLPVDAPKGYRRVIEHLAHKPTDFIGAFERFGKQPLKMALNAHQSYLWNQALESVVKQVFWKQDLIKVKYQAGRLMLPDASRPEVKLKEGLTSEYLQGFALTEDCSDLQGMYDDLPQFFDPDLFNNQGFPGMEEFGLKPNTHPRPLFAMLGGLKLIEKGGDLVKVGFTLPPGAYATVVIKLLTGY